jgi:hypothetical protein
VKTRSLQGDANSMMAADSEYENHHVFSELECYIDFYKNLSWSVFSFSSTGTNEICSIDYYVYSSIQGKLESIRVILNDGRINDAYALLREYYDSVIINVYSNLYLKENFSIESFIVEKIINWLKGKEQLPDFRIMSNYIRSSNKVAAINNLLYSDDRYKKVRARCNDHTHYEIFLNPLLNDNEPLLDNRLQVMNAFSGDARDVFILHLAYLFFLNDQYMTSSDYSDSLGCGMTPEPDSPSWVAPFIQEVFDDIIAKHRADIAKTIKQYACMQLS